MKKRALISVFDKTGILEFAQFLDKKGVEIISTGGTYRYLKENGLSVIDVSEVTNFKEMLDGRVKTLHPNIHGGILAIRDNKEHMDTIAKEGIETIDYVVVNLYPFFREVQTDKTFDEKIEFIDIGGPTMLRSAAKSFKDVTVICETEDYSVVMEEMEKDPLRDLFAHLPGTTSPLHWLYVLLQAMFQFNLQPTVLQAVGWILYIVPVLVLLTIQIQGPRRRPEAKAAAG